MGTKKWQLLEFMESRINRWSSQPKKSQKSRNPTFWRTCTILSSQEPLLRLQFASISLKKSPGFEGFVDRNCANPSWQPSSSASVFLKKIEQTANGYFTCVDDILTDDLFLTRVKNPNQ